MRRTVAVVFLGVSLLSFQPAVRAQSEKTYRARLSPVPVVAYTATVTGSGSVTATLTGTKLSIAGTFQGLNTPATVARIHKSSKPGIRGPRSEEHTSELQSRQYLVCRLLLEKKKEAPS